METSYNIVGTSTGHVFAKGISFDQCAAYFRDNEKVEKDMREAGEMDGLEMVKQTSRIERLENMKEFIERKIAEEKGENDEHLR